MTKQVTTREAALAVLSKANGGPEGDQGPDRGDAQAATGLRGAFPRQTCYSVIYGECRKPDGAFRLVAARQLFRHDALEPELADRAVEGGAVVEGVRRRPG